MLTKRTIFRIDLCRSFEVQKIMDIRYRKRRYLYTISKNDVISSVQKYYCTIGLSILFFSVKHVFEQV